VYDTLDDFDTRLSNTYLWRRRELGGLSGVGGGKKNRFLVCMCWEVTPVPSTPPSNRILNVSVADRALYCSWRVKCLSLTPFQLQPSICLFVCFLGRWEGGFWSTFLLHFAQEGLGSWVFLVRDSTSCDHHSYHGGSCIETNNVNP
jgi:hypothetical protein